MMKKLKAAQPERRIGSRYLVSLSCNFRTSAVKGRGRVTNVSDRGAFIEADDCPPLGELADVTVSCAPGTQIKVSAKVVHHLRAQDNNEPADGFGLYFIEFAEAQMRLLERFLRRRRDYAVIWS